jgi:uncharacterized protein YjgD (DUF1641 family)
MEENSEHQSHREETPESENEETDSTTSDVPDETLDNMIQDLEDSINDSLENYHNTEILERIMQMMNTVHSEDTEGTSREAVTGGNTALERMVSFLHTKVSLMLISQLREHEISLYREDYRFGYSQYM